ncbi:hypothetical protein B0I35DRAFT_420720 [Stachybotrys elegans]|uniref:Uncharacterized protein n=1 Tax=Stachybotrys elegans TaxID=80388 RepID=A0A8K0T3U1_9HYPO|nr:hypothetical protein B0I35DRAFT_420720 [Stachybotrys elegans]
MLFQKHFLLICHALLVIAEEPVLQRMKIPGVGFSLTPDYGVAAIYYKNGTWAEVARVEGSSTYSAMMRKAPSTKVPNKHSSWPLITEVICPVLDTFKPRLCKQTPDIESVKDLLQSLKAAVASHLGTTFCYAQIALPDREWTYQANVVTLALHSVRLHSIISIVDEARMAFWGSELAASGRPETDDTRSILVVNYSESGLSASLLAEDMGIVDVMRRSRDESLGAKNRAQPNHQKQVKAFLEKIMERPFGNDYFGQPMHEDLGKTVLHSDAIRDAEFLETFRSAIGSELSNAHGLDPVFAAAVGAAIIGYDRMDDWQFTPMPALGCTWLSGLYIDKGEL